MRLYNMRNIILKQLQMQYLVRSSKSKRVWIHKTVKGGYCCNNGRSEWDIESLKRILLTVWEEHYYLCMGDFQKCEAVLDFWRMSYPLPSFLVLIKQRQNSFWRTFSCTGSYRGELLAVQIWLLLKMYRVIQKKVLKPQVTTDCWAAEIM